MPTVAVIDEEEAVCDHAGECFRRAGFAVHSALTGDDGADLLLHKRFALIIVDVLLRDSKGVLVAETAAHTDTPVLLMTDQISTAAQLRKLQIPHLIKPFDLAELSRETVRVMVENRPTVLHVMMNLERLRRSVGELAAATAEASRLLEQSRTILARAGYSAFITSAPIPVAGDSDPIRMLQQASQELALGRTEQAEKLIAAAYEAYDRCGLGFWSRS